MYPLKFNNLYYEKIWGGRDLEKYRPNLPQGNIGESWDIACHEHGMSTVVNGYLKGKTLKEIIKSYGEVVLGNKTKGKEFPLLLKLINARENLSVQVHPNDEYAKALEAGIGKTEAWYVLDAQPGATLVLGTKKCNKEEFHEAIKENSLDKYLNTIKVKKGEVYFIPSGLIHSIDAGITIVEIQQNSDITYRVYDYGRGRDIHIEKSLEAIDFSLKGTKTDPIIEENENYKKLTHCLCEYFILEEIKIKTQLQQKTTGESFFIYTCVEGAGEILFKEGKEAISCGESILIPATLGEYELKGHMNLLKVFMP